VKTGQALGSGRGRGRGNARGGARGGGKGRGKGKGKGKGKTTPAKSKAKPKTAAKSKAKPKKKGKQKTKAKKGADADEEYVPPGGKPKGKPAETSTESTPAAEEQEAKEEQEDQEEQEEQKGEIAAHSQDGREHQEMPSGRQSKKQRAAQAKADAKKEKQKQKEEWTERARVWYEIHVKKASAPLIELSADETKEIESLPGWKPLPVDERTRLAKGHTDCGFNCAVNEKSPGCDLCHAVNEGRACDCGNEQCKCVRNFFCVLLREQGHSGTTWRGGALTEARKGSTTTFARAALSASRGCSPRTR